MFTKKLKIKTKKRILEKRQLVFEISSKLKMPAYNAKIRDIIAEENNIIYALY